MDDDLPHDPHADPRGIWRVVCTCGWKGERQLRNFRRRCPRMPVNHHPGDGDGHRILGGAYLRGPSR
jgi:hypothetical protein